MVRHLVAAPIVAPLVAASLWACDSAGGTDRGPMPALSFTFDDNATPGVANLGGELVMRGCSFSVREPTTGQYYVDGQADTSPSPTTVIVNFPQTNQTKPAVGTLAVPAQATVEVHLPSPYGVLDGAEGDVIVSEADGWRTVEVKDVVVSRSATIGVLNATLACGL